MNSKDKNIIDKLKRVEFLLKIHAAENDSSNKGNKSYNNWVETSS